MRGAAFTAGGTRAGGGLPREPALDELRARRGPAIEPRVVERALLEAGPLRADLAEVRAVELARGERASGPGHEKRSELLVEPEPAEIARDEVADGELEFVGP